MNNLSFNKKSKFENTMENHVEYKFQESTKVDPEVLKTLISKFKKDYQTVLKSVTELNNCYQTKEIYDAAIMIQNVEKSVEMIK